MREIFFILLVVLVLLILTAIRYRKQIVTMIGLARMLRRAKRSAQGAKSVAGNGEKSMALVNCTKCNIWVPQNKAVKFREGFICSNVCSKVEQAAEPAHRA